MIRKHVFYAGRVQGVGFRHTACALSRGRRVTGWVRNLSDGRVELVVEAAVSDADEFLAAIVSSLGGNIVRTEVYEDIALGEFTAFRQEATV